MIETAVIGYGTTGSGMVETLNKNRDVIVNQAGQGVEPKYVLDLREFPDSPVANKIVHNFKVIEQDEEVKIMVETTDGPNPAYPFMKVRLMADKNVITSNKAPVVVHGTGLLAITRKRHANFFFKASVGGGTSIIRPPYRCLMGEHIEKITGVLNGVTNFILTKMDKEGESFENALREAQNLECAERNPEADVEGHGTCRKIAILTAVTTGREVNCEDTYTGGIMRIMDVDFKYVEKMGTSVRLLETSRIKDGRILAYVAPVMINRTSPLYSVNNVFNGIPMKGDMLGTFMFYDSGAGKFPTGGVVVAGTIEAVQNLKKNVPMGWTNEKQAIESTGRAQFRYFVRVASSYHNKEQDVKDAFGQAEVIESYGMDEFAFLTAQVAEGEFRKATAPYDSREQEQSEYDIKQIVRVVLQHTASIINRIIGEVAGQGLPCPLHLLTGLYCPGCGGTRAFRALLAGNLLLSIRYHPLVAYMVVTLTVKLISFAVSRAAKNPRYHLGYEKLLVYTGAAIALVNWVYRNYMLVVRDVDLPLL